MIRLGSMLGPRMGQVLIKNGSHNKIKNDLREFVRTHVILTPGACAREVPNLSK